MGTERATRCSQKSAYQTKLVKPEAEELKQIASHETLDPIGQNWLAESGAEKNNEETVEIEIKTRQF